MQKTQRAEHKHSSEADVCCVGAFLYRCLGPGAMCGEAVVKLKKVSFRYGSEESGQSQHESLKSIDLVIPDVESVLLIGPSGCGKTKILRLIKSEALYASFECPIFEYRKRSPR